MHGSFHNFYMINLCMMTQTQRHKTNGTILFIHAEHPVMKPWLMALNYKAPNIYRLPQGD